MTTIPQTEGTYASLLDDLVEALLTFDEWSDADANVTNTGDSDGWRDNARVLSNSLTGTYLTFIAGYNKYDGSWHQAGIYVVHSNDWDTTDIAPAGKTNLAPSNNNTYVPPIKDDVTNRADDSFDEYGDSDSRHGCMIVGHVANSGHDYPESTSDGTDIRGDIRAWRDQSVTYFGSVNGASFSLGTWNTDGGESAGASYFAFEYLGRKFWDDSEVPTAIVQWDTGRGHATEYGFRTCYRRRDSLPEYVADGGAFEPGDWGRINPHGEDDTFAFRRPTVYNSESLSYPVSYLYELIPNHPHEGAAHGDEITHDGTTYRFLAQSGGGKNHVGDSVASVGIRYE